MLYEIFFFLAMLVLSVIIQWNNVGPRRKGSAIINELHDMLGDGTPRE